MDNHKTIRQIKTFIENGRTEIAADLLLVLTKSSKQFNDYLDEAVLVKNRIESVKRQDVIGAISFSDKNIEWARISNGLLSVVMDIEKELGIEPDMGIIEDSLTHQTTQPISTTKPLPFFPLPRVFIFSILGLIAIGSIVYFIQTMLSHDSKPTVFTVSIEAFKDEQKTVFTEGGLILHLNDFPQKKTGLNTSGKTIMNDCPAKALKNKEPLQLDDTAFYTILRQEVDVNTDLKTIKLIIQPKTITYKGKIINSDGLSVGNALFEIGNGIAQTKTDAVGNFSINIPKKNIGESLNFLIQKDGKILKNEKNWVNEKVLYSLKVH